MDKETMQVFEEYGSWVADAFDTDDGRARLYDAAELALLIIHGKQRAAAVVEPPDGKLVRKHYLNGVRGHNRVVEQLFLRQAHDLLEYDNPQINRWAEDNEGHLLHVTRALACLLAWVVDGVEPSEYDAWNIRFSAHLFRYVGCSKRESRGSSVLGSWVPETRGRRGLDLG